MACILVGEVVMMVVGVMVILVLGKISLIENCCLSVRCSVFEVFGWWEMISLTRVQLLLQWCWRWRWMIWSWR